MVASKLLAGFVPAVPAGQSDDPRLRVFNQIGVEIVLVRDGQLENDLLALFKGVQAGEQLPASIGLRSSTRNGPRLGAPWKFWSRT